VLKQFETRRPRRRRAALLEASPPRNVRLADAGDRSSAALRARPHLRVARTAAERRGYP
jgi:hypothetical protein